MNSNGQHKLPYYTMNTEKQPRYLLKAVSYFKNDKEYDVYMEKLQEIRKYAVKNTKRFSEISNPVDWDFNGTRSHFPIEREQGPEAFLEIIKKTLYKALQANRLLNNKFVVLKPSILKTTYGCKSQFWHWDLGEDIRAYCYSVIICLDSRLLSWQKPRYSFEQGIFCFY